MQFKYFKKSSLEDVQCLAGLAFHRWWCGTLNFCHEATKLVASFKRLVFLHLPLARTYQESSSHIFRGAPSALGDHRITSSPLLLGRSEGRHRTQAVHDLSKWLIIVAQVGCRESLVGCRGGYTESSHHGKTPSTEPQQSLAAQSHNQRAHEQCRASTSEEVHIPR